MRDHNWTKDRYRTSYISRNKNRYVTVYKPLYKLLQHKLYLKSLLWYDYLEKQRSQEQTQFLAGLSSLITELGAEE